MKEITPIGGHDLSVPLYTRNEFLSVAREIELMQGRRGAPPYLAFEVAAALAEGNAKRAKALSLFGLSGIYPAGSEERGAIICRYLLTAVRL